MRLKKRTRFLKCVARSLAVAARGVKHFPLAALNFETTGKGAAREVTEILKRAMNWRTCTGLGSWVPYAFELTAGQPSQVRAQKERQNEAPQDA
jgi:hypothetical protein